MIALFVYTWRDATLGLLILLLVLSVVVRLALDIASAARKRIASRLRRSPQTSKESPQE